MSISVQVKQLGKPTKSLELEEGTTIANLMSQLGMEPSGKQFTVRGENGSNLEDASYVLKDTDVLSISVKNSNG